MDEKQDEVKLQLIQNHVKPVQQVLREDDTTTKLDRQMRLVMYLMNARSAGNATNEEVEIAVQRMIELQRHSGGVRDTSTISHTNVHKHQSEEGAIDKDEGNYDDIEETKTDNYSTQQIEQETESKSEVAEKSTILKKNNVNDNCYDEIPLGRQGAKMMTNFGDGKNPHPAAVEATLLGARRMLQAAIQDARYVRRKNKVLFKSAKQSVQAKATEQSLKAEWSSELLFRAGERYDRLSRDPKCGFDIEEIRELFPEEMDSFTRWLEMRTASEKSNSVEERERINEYYTNQSRGTYDIDTGGHLQSRAHQFDRRTDKMKQEWYLKFAMVRRGSFLTKRMGPTGDDDLEWETTNQRGKIPGRPKDTQGTWTSLQAASIRFLHWVGFDPQSPLPPPDDITTQALAFLAHDFVGRIVEKAIYLRTLGRKNKFNGVECLLELEDGEQLEVRDIERAMDDPDINPVPLFCSSKDKKLGPQLYFGPGFENRLEMELEEFVRSNKNISLTEEELQIRQAEDELFEQIATPPTVDWLYSIVDTSVVDQDNDEDKPEHKRQKIMDSV